MADLKSVLLALNELAPSEIKEPWDNVGLMVGDLSSQIKGAVIALDCTLSVIDEALETGANLIVTHHPLIFGSINCIDYDDLNGLKLKKLIKNDINVISLHTNLDKAKDGVNDTLCEVIELYNVENLTDEEFSLGRTGLLKKQTTLKEFAMYIKEKLNVSSLKYIGDDNKVIKKVAVTSGSGSEFYTDAIKAQADVFVTSEVKHHIATEVIDKNFAIIDAGHFETENIIVTKIKCFLDERFDFKVSISKAQKNIFKAI